MRKKILVYHWGALGDKAYMENMQAAGMECIEFSGKMEDYHADGNFARDMLEVIHGNGVEAVFSYDYFPLISMLCDMNHIPYVGPAAFLSLPHAPCGAERASLQALLH